ncbi:MAG: PHP domain-containing protein [Deltaproteobacteria bacterium]|nr:PHP domain-containing protein [Deltaproteobacteria bacterium]
MFDHEVVGNLHIHSLHSDGAGTVAEIAATASAAGLDFICINDHDTMMDSLPLQEEGFYGKILVLVGLEIGGESHHYLAYGIHSLIRSEKLGAQDVIDRVGEQGGFGYLAHPFERGMPFVERSRAYRWKDLSVRGFSGICIWNFSSRWKERIKTPLHGLFHLLFKRRALKGPSRETLSFWDSQCREGRVSAIGGSDAHGGLFRWGPFHFTPLHYRFLLNTINVHVLLPRRIPGDFAQAKNLLYEAMRSGRMFVAHDGLCPAKGFRFDFASDDGSDLYMGEEGRFHPGDLVVELPREGDIRLFRDGGLVRSWRGSEAVFRVEKKGVYRVEVFQHVFLFGWRPWIYSNPIYLR